MDAQVETAESEPIPEEKSDDFKDMVTEAEAEAEADMIVMIEL